MKEKILVLITLVGSLASSSCSLFDQKMPDAHDLSSFLDGEGVFVVNEGNYLAGNGSVSFYSFDSMYINNDIFSRINNRPVGDIPNHIAFSGNCAYITVNNSGTVEIVNKDSFRSLKTIRDLVSPRQLLPVNETKAYISSLASNKLTILDLVSSEVSGYIDLRRSSESMILSGKKVYVSNWVSGNEILVVDIEKDIVVDSVIVGHEPESMAVDKNGHIWVLCSGSYSGEYFPSLVCIDTSDNSVINELVFPSSAMYPTCLAVCPTGDTLYYVENGIWRFPVDAPTLPSAPFVKPSGRHFYKAGIDIETGVLFATNAVDFQREGYLLWFDRNGLAVDSVSTDIIPGVLFFKREPD